MPPGQSRELVEAALALGAAGAGRPAIEHALRTRGCPENDVARLVRQSLRFGEDTRRARLEEAMRARVRSARKVAGAEREGRRALAWTLSITALGVGSVLGALVLRLAR